MAIDLETFEFFPSERVRGKGSALEPVSDVAEVRDPPEVYRYGIKADKESGKEEERHRHDWSEENTVLNIHGCADDKADGLGDK